MAKLQDQISFDSWSLDQGSGIRVFRHCRDNSFVHVLSDGRTITVPIRDYVTLLHPQDCRCSTLTRLEFSNRVRMALDWGFWLLKVGLFLYSLYAGASMMALQIAV